MGIFSRVLNQWYRKHARTLPWRRTKDPYKIWISEVMLQQTTVNTVIPYYERWIKVFPDVFKVAKASEQTVLKMWQGLGYYSRAKNLYRSAKQIVNEFGGKIPDCADVLKDLPGFGPYTIGAVLSIAFDQRYPIVDANIRRVVMRLLAKEGVADTSFDAMILKFLDQVMPKRNLRTFNQAFMELGALVCRNREPLCLICPVRSFCKAYQLGIQEIIPTPKTKNIKTLDVAIGILKRKNKYFIQKRPSHGLLADLWEFPGGKVEGRERPIEALKRELKEEIGVDIKKTKHLMNIQHFYTEFKVNLHVFDCEVSTCPKTDKTHRWVNKSQMNRFPMPSGSAKIVEKLGF